MNKITNKIKTDEIKLTDKEKLVVRSLASRRDSLAKRYPFAFAGLATFGIVSVVYGFEKLIDKVDVFAENPWILLVTGLVTLLVTGTLYKKL